MKHLFKLSITRLLPLLLIAALLGGCGSDTTKVTYGISMNGVDIAITYYAKDDIVTKQTTKNVVPYEVIGVSDEESARVIFDPLSLQFQGIEGMEEKITYGKESLTETITIDYEKVNISEIADLPGSMFEGDLNGKVSLQKSVELLEQSGFQKVK